jgi:uncharacterized protein (DUF433 family)
MINWNTCPCVELNPELVSGAWVFRGTRVPVVALFENLEDGITINEFVELFPGVGNTCSIKNAFHFTPCVNSL